GCRRSEDLARQLTARGIKTALWDERYTSLAAESILKEAGLGWRKANDKIDKIAASLILEDYLKTKEK
ncbi:MAG: Holliday junction resolvase RuvX, partial [Spirochaeta sp.]|nr:Holliday junction resolvase RuvX [Spirochaeta sp.]